MFRKQIILLFILNSCAQFKIESRDPVRATSKSETDAYQGAISTAIAQCREEKKTMIVEDLKSEFLAEFYEATLQFHCE